MPLVHGTPIDRLGAEGLAGALPPSLLDPLMDFPRWNARKCREHLEME